MEISFQKLEAEAPAAAALLNLCAYFAPDDIPSDTFAAQARFLPEPLRAAVTDPLAFDDAIAALRHYSLIETGEKETLSLPRLVQAAIRARLRESAQKQWAEAAMEVVGNAFPSKPNDVQTWKECDRLLPHVIITVDFADGLDRGFYAAGRVLSQLGLYAKARGEYVAAKNHYEHALKVRRKYFPFDYHNLIRGEKDLGSVLLELGDLPTAKTAFDRALHVIEAKFGPDSMDVATELNDVGHMLLKANDLPGAKAAYERALRIDEKVFGPEHPNVAADVSNLGRVLKALGDLPGAKAAFERTLRIYEKAFSFKNLDVAFTLRELCFVLKALGDAPGAKAALERALAIIRGIYGPKHRLTKHLQNDLESLGGAVE